MTVLQRSIPVTALMSKSHPLANSSRVSLKDLTGYPFIADAHIDPDDTLDVLGLQSHTDLLYICDRGTIFDAVRKGNYIATDQHSGGGCPADELRLLSHRGRRSHGRGPAAFPDIYAPPQREALHSLSD